MTLLNFLKRLLIIIILFSIFILGFYSKLTPREGKKIPFNNHQLTTMFYCSIIIASLFVIMVIIFLVMPEYKNGVVYTSYLEKKIYIFKDLDLFIIYLDNNWLNFDGIFNRLHRNNLLIINIFFNYIIRFLLVIIFTVDVFYLNHISFFYKMLPLLIIPMTFNIFFFILKRFFESQCDILNPRIQMVSFKYYGDAGVIPLKDYIHHFVLNRYKNISQNITLVMHPDFVGQWQRTHNKILDRKAVKLLYTNLVKNYIKYYDVIFQVETKKLLYDKYINSIIRFCYFIGWMYIFYLSDPKTFQLILYGLLENLHCTEEPFSGLFLPKNPELEIV